MNFLLSLKNNDLIQFVNEDLYSLKYKNLRVQKFAIELFLDSFENGVRLVFLKKLFHRSIVDQLVIDNLNNPNVIKLTQSHWSVKKFNFILRFY